MDIFNVLTEEFGLSPDCFDEQQKDYLSSIYENLMSDDEYSTLDRAQEFVEALSSFHDSFRDAEIAHLGKIMELTWSLRSNESYDSLAENNDILRALKFDGQTKQNSQIISNETDKVNSAELLKRYGVTKERENCSTYIPPIRSPPKQMLRYRDNKIVSTKGEKFVIEVDKEEQERLKSTFVNLKPLRRYRFH